MVKLRFFIGGEAIEAVDVKDVVGANPPQTVASQNGLDGLRPRHIPQSDGDPPLDAIGQHQVELRESGDGLKHIFERRPVDIEIDPGGRRPGKGRLAEHQH